MSVAGEVEVEVLHRHDLRVAAAGRAALDAEGRPERRLADVGHRALADAVHRLSQADRGQRLALAQRHRRHAGYDDELAVGAVLESVQDFERDFRLVLSVLLNLVFQQSELGSNLANWLEGCFLRDLKVALHLYDSLWCLWLRHRWPEHITNSACGRALQHRNRGPRNLTLLSGHNKRNLSFG